MNKIKTNIIFNITYQVLILIVPLITTPYVSRVLLPEGIGNYAITTSIAKYFLLFSLLGMTTYGNRTIAKANSKNNNQHLSETFWNLFYFQLLNSIIFNVLFVIYIIYIGYDKYNMLILCQIPYTLTAIFEVSWFFSGTEKFKLLVIRNTIIKVLTALSIFLFVHNPSDLWIYIIINSVSLLLGQVCLWPAILKKVRITKPNFKIILKHIKPNLILFISVVAVSIYTLMDKVMIEYYANVKELGFFENSYKIMDICCSIIGAIGAVMLPRMCSLVEENNNKKIELYVTKSMKYIMILAFGITFGMAAIAPEFSTVYFGKSFSKSGIVMMVIAPTIALYSWENIIKNQYLLPNGKDKVFVKATILAALTNLFLNYVLIRKLGAAGAAIGTVGALFVACLYQTMSSRKYLDIKKYIFMQIPWIIFGIIMFVCCRIISSYIDHLVISLFVEILLGGIIYLLLVFVYLLVTKDELLYEFYKKAKIVIKKYRR